MKADGIIETKHTFTKDGKEETVEIKNAAEIINKIVAASVKALPTGETGTETLPQSKQDKVVAGDRAYLTGESTDEKIKAVMAARKVTYEEAFNIVASEQN
jgi:hypothetical protein